VWSLISDASALLLCVDHLWNMFTGMAAISSSILALCNSGDHVVCSHVVYGGTHAFMKSFLPLKCGITVTFVDITHHDAVAAAFTDHTKVGVPCQAMAKQQQQQQRTAWSSTP